MYESKTKFRVGVDIGGTFTDIVVLGSDGSALTRKVSSTPDDYGRGIMEGLEAVFRDGGIDPGEVDGIVHATTVATNAVLENQGADTGLITTEGFRDVLEIRRCRIPDMYNLDYEKPPPLVPRRLRREVRERMGPRGEVRIPLDEESAYRAAERLRDEEVEAVAISLLHSYANPDHEQRVARIVRDVLPPDVYVTCSHEILPEIREYERTSTTVVNALLGPVVSRYLASLVQRLERAGVGRPLQVMQSNGGLSSVRTASRGPARILESGPAAGVIAAARVARRSGVDNLITLDMGGTTAKAAIIEDGEPARTTEYEVGAGINLSSRLMQGAGYSVKLPVIDISEIGAGGGSLVWFDRGGLVQVGPRSAGAVPGPVCYGIGGTQATLTDALVALGYINPVYLVGGAVALDAGRARDALREQLATRIDRSLAEAAYGVYVIAASNMIRAVKAVSTYRGRDPRDFTLFAFGGNGPVVALEIARELGIGRLLVPPNPGVFSAFGLLVSGAEYESLQTLVGRMEELSPVALGQAFARLASDLHESLALDGHRPDQARARRFADLRYAGQAFELTVPVEEGTIDSAAMGRLVSGFHAEHERTYGHRRDSVPVEIVNIRLGLRADAGSGPTFDSGRLPAPADSNGGAPRERTAYFGSRTGPVSTPVVTRGELADRTLEGPLIIEEYDATCVVPPGCRARIDALGNIDIHIDHALTQP